MEVHHRETQNQKTIKHGISLWDRETNRTDELDTRIVSISIYQLPTRLLEQAITICGVCIQQWMSGDHQDNTLLHQLRNQPQTSTHHRHDDWENLINKWHEGTTRYPQSRNGKGTITTQGKLRLPPKTWSKSQSRRYGVVPTTQRLHHTTIEEIELQENLTIQTLGKDWNKHF